MKAVKGFPEAVEGGGQGREWKVVLPDDDHSDRRSGYGPYYARRHLSDLPAKNGLVTARDVTA